MGIATEDGTNGIGGMKLKKYPVAEPRDFEPTPVDRIEALEGALATLSRTARERNEQQSSFEEATLARIAAIEKTLDDGVNSALSRLDRQIRELGVAAGRDRVDDRLDVEALRKRLDQADDAIATGSEAILAITRRLDDVEAVLPHLGELRRRVDALEKGHVSQAPTEGALPGDTLISVTDWCELAGDRGIAPERRKIAGKHLKALYDSIHPTGPDGKYRVTDLRRYAHFARTLDDGAEASRKDWNIFYWDAQKASEGEL